MTKTADELAYERYLKGEYAWNDYIVVCCQEDCEPENWEEHARDILLKNTDEHVPIEWIEDFIFMHWQNLSTDEENLNAFFEWIKD